MKTSFGHAARPEAITGNQLKAARALLGMHQSDLARDAQLNVNTIRHMESSGSDPNPGRPSNINAVLEALEAAGIEFLNGGSPGVRLRIQQ